MRHSPNKKSPGKIHFAIVPTNDGFTYQLYEWSFLHEIGTFLGYAYFHIHFDTPRSKSPDAGSDIYDFLGITQHFQAMNAAAGDEFERHIEIHLPEHLIWYRQTSNIAFLVNHVKRNVERQLERGQKTLVKLIMEPPTPDKLESATSVKNVFETQSGRKTRACAGHLRRLYYAARLAVGAGAKTSRAAWRYGPDLHSIYIRQRKTHPWPSRFLPGRTKVAVHIRRGDYTVIKAPWGDTIKCTARGGPRDRHISTADFKRFIEELTSRLREHDLSTLFFSDGYDNTQTYLRENKEKHKLSEEQVELLTQQVIADGKREFSPLEDTPNSKVIIGEDLEKLCDLVHSYLEADVIVTATYYKFTRKLGGLYFDNDRAPIIILLHQGDPDLHEHPPIPPPSNRTVFFNVRDPDYAALVERLKKWLP